MPIKDLNRICPQCHKAFVLPHGDAQGMRWCSLACRLDSKLDKSAGPQACWNWTAKARTQGGDGYGVMNIGGKLVGAHRVAYGLALGVDPGALFVCHRCDNVLCCNPAHLFLGTHRDNMLDMHAKGRSFISDAARKCLSEARVGKTRPPEVVAKTRLGRLGKAPANKGVPGSEETRAKLRAAWRIRRARDYPHLTCS